MEPDPLDREIARLSWEGWEVVSRTPQAVRLRRAKRAHQLGFVLLVVIPWLAGYLFNPAFYCLALVGLGIVLSDYIMRPDDMLYVSVADLDTSSPERLSPPSRLLQRLQHLTTGH